jgi:hypothetical protein
MSWQLRQILDQRQRHPVGDRVEEEYVLWGEWATLSAVRAEDSQRLGVTNPMEKDMCRGRPPLRAQERD